MDNKWEKLANEKSLDKIMKALEANGIKVMVVENGEEAFRKVSELIPKNSEVMDMSSMTLEKIGLTKEIQESDKYISMRKKIMSADQKEIRDILRKQSSAVDYTIGSVQAVTEDGKVVIASNSGSQLPAYAFGAKKLIWIVGTQKIVKNLDDAFKRIYEHSFPKEDERAKIAYGMPSGVNKILIINKEIVPERITLIFVKEVLGF